MGVASLTDAAMFIQWLCPKYRLLEILPLVTDDAGQW